MRYTPKKSMEAVRQSWLTKSPNDPRLNEMGRRLAKAARDPELWKKLLVKIEQKNA